MYIILLGAPGAGKGTQADTLVRELELVHVASGDLFRQALGQETELGLKAKSYMEKGMLVPDEVTIQMVLERLSAPDCESGAILDGFPRNLNQAEALDKTLAERGKAIDRVVYIKVSEDELVRRLSGRWICRDCQMPYHATDSPPRVWGKCDKCGGENIAWSEYADMIWCYDCEIDTKGTAGIFDGPVPVNICKMMGMSLEKVRLS